MGAAGRCHRWSMLLPHGLTLSVQLMSLRRRLREFLALMASKGKRVPMRQAPCGGLYVPDREVDGLVWQVVGDDAQAGEPTASK